MNYKEQSQLYHDTYKTILGRNLYNQSLRNYVYTPHENGNYYSDCSSSICSTINKVGIKMSNLNTAGMYYSKSWREVDVTIKNGHVIPEDIHKLQVGDALMFKGTDSSRPLRIGHVESIYEINGTTERNITLAGHGSGNPSTKNMKTYCTSRYNSKTSKGLDKGLVCVLRCMEDKEEEVTPIKPVPPIGWNFDANVKKWWFNFGNGAYPKADWYSCLCETDGNYHWFLFDKDGWMLTGRQEFKGESFYLCESGDLVGACMVTNDRGVLDYLVDETKG